MIVASIGDGDRTGCRGWRLALYCGCTLFLASATDRAVWSAWELELRKVLKLSTMLLDSGVTGFRFFGVHWDGGGSAWYGVAHQSIKMFETECHHEAEAFSNFAYAGIAIDRYRLQSPNHIDGATAETYFRNCIFENSAIGVLWNNFNDLDNHFDGCLFRNMLMGVYGVEGTVYMMNSRFENSSAVDISRNAAEWNHDTLRNVISVGSNMFIRSDAALSLYDCHVYGWVGDTNIGKDFKKLAEGSYTPCSCDIYSKDCHRPRGDCPNIYWRNGAAMAVLGQMQIHDSTFTNAQCNQSVVPDPPPGGNLQGQHHGNSTGVICCVLDGWDFNTHTNDDPVLIANSSLGPPATGYPTPEWTCKHEIPTNGHDTEVLEHGSLKGMIYLSNAIAGEPALGPNVTVLDLPTGNCPATGIGPATNFHKDRWDIPTTVIEISKFGPFPSRNKSLDATDAVQQTIDAAAKASDGAVAYFPPGFYYISKTITVSGTDFWVSGGNSLATVFQWRGDSEPSSGMISVAAGSQVHLEEFSLRILNKTDSVPKILVTGTAGTISTGAEGTSTLSSAACTNVSVNRVNAGGYGSVSHTGTSGLRMVNLAKCDVVNVHHMDGDMHAKNNDGVVLTGFQTAGGLVLEGSSEGFFGQRVRFTCCTHDFTTKVLGGQTYACAAYYQESAPNIFGCMAPVGTNAGEGAPGRVGNVAINAIKLSATNWLNSDFEKWSGNFFQTGGWATTQGAHLKNKTSLNMTVRANGPANLTYTLAFPWDLTYTFDIRAGAQLTEIGTCQHDDTGARHTKPDQQWSGSASTIVRGYDLLRRLGRVDLQHNYPALGIKDVCAGGNTGQ